MLTHSVQIVGYGTHKKLNPNGMFQNRKARIKQTPLVELCGPDDQDWKNDSPVDGFLSQLHIPKNQAVGNPSAKA